MRRYRSHALKSAILLWVIMLFSTPALAAPAQVKVLYSLTSQSAHLLDNRLTLHGIPSVLHFSERDGNQSGFVSLQEFYSHLSNYITQEAGKPQVAAISIYNNQGANNAILEFSAPKIENGNLSLHVKLLQGTLPKEIRTSTLFIVMLENTPADTEDTH